MIQNYIQFFMFNGCFEIALQKYYIKSYQQTTRDPMLSKEHFLL